MKIPNGFSGTIFHRHRIQIESGALNTDSPNIYFFFPSTSSRIEDINKYMGSVNLVSIDIQEDNFEIEERTFDLSKLDFDNPEKHKMRVAVLRVFRKVEDLSNFNLVKNADRLLATRPINKNIEWVGESGRVPENLYALSY